MKNRRFPYGYEMQKGQIIICTAEAETVKRIFSEYVAGDYLGNIAESLTRGKVEYLPGEFQWNKSRVKRMIEDERYIGDNTYPPIIDMNLFRKANAEKNARRTYTKPTIPAESKQLIDMVICKECGSKLLHRTDNTQKHGERWYCPSEHSKYGTQMTGDELEKDVTALLNQLIAEPALAEPSDSEVPNELSLEMQRMENEVERQLASLDFGKEELQNMILQCVAKKYSEHKSTQHITDRLKADFENSDPLSSFCMELFDRTVSAVIIGNDKTVGLKLKNNKIISKGSADL